MRDEYTLVAVKMESRSVGEPFLGIIALLFKLQGRLRIPNSTLSYKYSQCPSCSVPACTAQSSLRFTALPSLSLLNTPFSTPPHLLIDIRLPPVSFLRVSPRIALAFGERSMICSVSTPDLPPAPNTPYYRTFRSARQPTSQLSSTCAAREDVHIFSTTGIRARPRRRARCDSPHAGLHRARVYLRNSMGRDEVARREEKDVRGSQLRGIYGESRGCPQTSDEEIDSSVPTADDNGLRMLYARQCCGITALTTTITAVESSSDVKGMPERGASSTSSLPSRLSEPVVEEEGVMWMDKDRLFESEDGGTPRGVHQHDLAGFEHKGEMSTVLPGHPSCPCPLSGSHPRLPLTRVAWEHIPPLNEDVSRPPSTTEDEAEVIRERCTGWKHDETEGVRRWMARGLAWTWCHELTVSSEVGSQSPRRPSLLNHSGSCDEVTVEAEMEVAANVEGEDVVVGQTSTDSLSWCCSSEYMQEDDLGRRSRGKASGWTLRNLKSNQQKQRRSVGFTDLEEEGEEDWADGDILQCISTPGRRAREGRKKPLSYELRGVSARVPRTQPVDRGARRRVHRVKSSVVFESIGGGVCRRGMLGERTSLREMFSERWSGELKMGGVHRISGVRAGGEEDQAEKSWRMLQRVSVHLQCAADAGDVPIRDVDVDGGIGRRCWEEHILRVLGAVRMRALYSDGVGSNSLSAIQESWLLNGEGAGGIEV
ncbi:hypothetical protein R3P38DRAFT_2807284 [Favolaschia claudopus]|uniref:Uncharacterized protein n=1 Tax=Favolaschia claudopus TaxID=2862362 RepID=A0AAV9ZIZ1_9AGAR